MSKSYSLFGNYNSRSHARPTYQERGLREGYTHSCSGATQSRNQSALYSQYKSVSIHYYSYQQFLHSFDLFWPKAIWIEFRQVKVRENQKEEVVKEWEILQKLLKAH